MVGLSKNNIILSCWPKKVANYLHVSQEMPKVMFIRKTHQVVRNKRVPEALHT